MLHTILVPLDGSAFGEQALPMALSVARPAGAAIEVMQVHELYALKDTASRWGPFDPTEDAHEARENEIVQNAFNPEIGAED